MFLLYALLFSLLASTVVSQPNGPYLRIRNFQYYGEWYRTVPTLNGLYDDDVMDVNALFIGFGRLNPTLGQKALIHPHPYLDRGIPRTCLWYLAPMPKDSVPIGDRLDELEIWGGGNTIWARIIRVRVTTRIPDIPILAGNLVAGAPPTIEGTFYRILTKDSRYHHDVIVLRPGHASKLYSLTSGNIARVTERIKNKRLVGCWSPWPDPSDIRSVRRHDLLIFWMEGSTLKHGVPTLGTQNRAARAYAEEEMTPSGHESSDERSTPPPSYNSLYGSG
ncbi:hypothetical protein F5887DRAFT_1081990 [Amanita rubescens]|nr:hypothetical protein F5887DRAFT_1081990 [Amanita rubescens]